MQDYHVELTAEIRGIVDVFAETKYNNKEKHPVVHAVIQRLRKALEEFGKTALIISKKAVSEEVREALYDREVLPLLNKLEEMSIRYSMPSIVALEWGDDGQCATFMQPAGQHPCPLLQHLMLLVSTGGDIDEYMSKVASLARMFGHSSNVLDKLGIPRDPPPDIQEAVENAGV